MNAPLASCPFSAITFGTVVFGWLQQQTHPKVMTENGQLRRSASHQYLTNVQSCNRRFGRQTIHPTQKFTSMNLLQMPCFIT
jgi:hypothetical protein